MFADYLLHHVGVVFPSLEDAENHLADFGLTEDYRGFVPQWSCWCIFTLPRSGAAIELVVPQGGPLERFNKGAGGVHHFAYEVENLAETTEWLRGKGMTMIEPEPIKGAGNFYCNFLTPASSRGIQIEFIERYF
jgi:methylmalonyl-CoA/ethylmalonyl-CoA epimerase